MALLLWFRYLLLAALVILVAGFIWAERHIKD
jgi:hypothetical protein